LPTTTIILLQLDWLCGNITTRKKTVRFNWLSSYSQIIKYKKYANAYFNDTYTCIEAFPANENWLETRKSKRPSPKSCANKMSSQGNVQGQESTCNFRIQ